MYLIPCGVSQPRGWWPLGSSKSMRWIVSALVGWLFLLGQVALGAIITGEFTGTVTAGAHGVSTGDTFVGRVIYDTEPPEINNLTETRGLYRWPHTGGYGFFIDYLNAAGEVVLQVAPDLTGELTLDIRMKEINFEGILSPAMVVWQGAHQLEVGSPVAGPIEILMQVADNLDSAAAGTGGLTDPGVLVDISLDDWAENRQLQTRLPVGEGITIHGNLDTLTFGEASAEVPEPGGLAVVGFALVAVVRLRRWHRG